MNKTCINCFKSLGIGSRAKIYMHLSMNGPKNVTEVTNLLGLRQPTVSYHLNEMVKTGLLNKRKVGKNMVFSVNTICPHMDNQTECIVKT